MIEIIYISCGVVLISPLGIGHGVLVDTLFKVPSQELHFNIILDCRKFFDKLLAFFVFALDCLYLNRVKFFVPHFL